MRILFVTILALSLTGCETLVKKIPSFWDDNQSQKIIDVRLKVDSVDCKEPQLPQARAIASDLRWFELYSQSKGTRQHDVLAIIKPMQETVTDWVKRSEQSEGTEAYCTIKKSMMQRQAARAAEAILGRF